MKPSGMTIAHMVHWLAFNIAIVLQRVIPDWVIPDRVILHRVIPDRDPGGS